MMVQGDAAETRQNVVVLCCHGNRWLGGLKPLSTRLVG
jgi:hypothetical protein